MGRRKKTDEQLDKMVEMVRNEGDKPQEGLVNFEHPNRHPSIAQDPISGGYINTESFAQKDPDEDLLNSFTNAFSPETESVATDNPLAAPPEAERPLPTDPTWSDWVIQQFTEDELYQGQPTVDGLRRVAQIVIGTIKASISTILFSTETRVTAQHQIVFEDERMFGDCADVTKENIQAIFGNFLTACACTRAEGRALRKALGLKHVVAAEELNDKAPLAESLDGNIQDVQKRTLNVLCERLDINGLLFVNSGASKYEKISDITSATAVKMIQKLNDFNRDQAIIPENLKGYQKGWI